MKKLTILLILSILLGACSKKEIPEANNDEQTIPVETIDYGHGSKPMDFETLIIDDETIQFQTQFMSQGTGLKSRYFVFINSIPQKYSLNGSEFSYYHDTDADMV